MQIQTHRSFHKNLNWIFWGNLVHSGLNFLLNILVARKLSTSDYGTLNYVNSLVLFATSLGALGFDKTLVKFLYDEKNNAGNVLGSSILLRGGVSLTLIAILQLFLFFCFDDKNLNLIFFIQSLSVIFSAFQVYVYWFRYKNEAYKGAIARLIAFFISAIVRICILLTSKNIVLYVCGIVLEPLLFSLILQFLYKKNSSVKLGFSKKTSKKLLKKSLPFAFSAILVTVYSQTDKIMLKTLIDSEAVAMYSVSVVLAGALTIIPTTLIDAFSPEIMRAKAEGSQGYYEKRMQQLYAIVFYVSLLYCIVVSIFTKEIILLVYGEKYIGAIPGLSLIVWYTAFSYFGAINNLYLVAEDKTAWVQVLTISGACLNIILNFFLIPQYGIVGAAFASLCTQIMANFILLAIIKPLRGGFKIIMSGILLKWIKKG